jgi:hypothetical protein
MDTFICGYWEWGMLQTVDDGKARLTYRAYIKTPRNHLSGNSEVLAGKNQLVAKGITTP